MSVLRADITLDGHQLMLYRPGNGRGRAVHTTAVPARATETFLLADEPLALDTFHLGMGYSQRVLAVSPFSVNADPRFDEQRLLAGVYSYGVRVDARFPRLAMPGPELNAVTLTGATDHARGAFEIGTDLYLVAGRYAYKLPNTFASGSVASDVDFGVGYDAASAVPFRGKGYVGGTNAAGTIQPLWQLAAGVWSNTPSDGTVLAKHLGTVFWATDYRFVYQDGSSTIRHVASDPMSAAAASAPITIGDDGYPITRLIDNGQHLYVAKTSGLHDLDGTSGHSPNLTPQFRYVLDDENGIAGHAADGRIVTAYRKGLLLAQVTGLDNGKIWPITPGYGLPNETPIRGIVTATAQEGAWTIAAVWNGTDTYICWGRPLRGDEVSASPSPFLWHGALVMLAGLKCYLLHVSAQTDPPKLWIGAGSATAGYGVKWCYLARTEHPLQDAEYRFATSYSLYVPALDWNHVATRKNLLQIDVEGDNLGVGVSLGVYHNVDGGSYSLFGTANTSPQSTLLPKTEIIGRRIGLRLDGSGTSTSGANIRGLELRAAARVQTREIREYQCVLATNRSDRMGGSLPKDPAALWDALRALETGSQVTLRDELGDTLTALVHAPVERVEMESRGPDGHDSAEPIQLATLRVSILSRLGAGARWGAGATWGSSKVWGGTTV